MILPFFLNGFHPCSRWPSASWPDWHTVPVAVRRKDKMKSSSERSAGTAYGEEIGRRMRTSDNPVGAPLTLREVAQRIGYSYEHVRKHLVGHAPGSREFNHRICSLLGLDEEKMLALMNEFKIQRKIRNLGFEPADFQAPARMNRLETGGGWVVRWSQTTLVEAPEKSTALDRFRQSHPLARIAAVAPVRCHESGALSVDEDMAFDDVIGGAELRLPALHLDHSEARVLVKLLANQTTIDPALARLRERVAAATS